jgi:renalase
MPKAVVVGAGIAGLIAARRLQKSDWDVVVLEKSRGLGGRMATRRIEPATFDHGAQYFTMHSMFFRSLVETLQDEDLVKGWCRGFLNTDRQLILDGYQRFFAPEGMSSIAKFIAKPLTVKKQTLVTRITQAESTWQIDTESPEGNPVFEADALILTAPVPQSLKLLSSAENLELSEKQQTQLKNLKYDPCITLMAVLDGPSGLSEPGAIRVEDPMSPVMWIADNAQKGLSKTPSITVHGTPHFSRKHWKIPREEAGALLWQGARRYISAQALTQVTHGWRFAQPQDVHEEKSFGVETRLPLRLAGDCFGDIHNLIEGAALSGLDAAQKILKDFS